MNEPLAQRPPPPEVPKAIASVLAPREGIAFGDLEPLPQPTTPTTPIDVARREAVAAPGTPQSPQPLSPTPIYNPDEVPEVPTITEETRRGNKIPPTPKAEINPIRSPPENPRTPASPDDISDDDDRPHSNNYPYRRVKCVPCDLTFMQFQLTNHDCVSSCGSIVPIDVVNTSRTSVTAGALKRFI